MITKIFKERKVKSEQFDKLVKEIKRRFETCDNALEKYMKKIPKDDITHISDEKRIHNLDVEWHVYKSLLETIEGL